MVVIDGEKMWINVEKWYKFYWNNNAFMFYKQLCDRS